MRLVLGSDHGALTLKKALEHYLTSTRPEWEISDIGTFDTQSVDYPDFSDKVVHEIQENGADLGILCCGTGIGVSIRANRYPGIRAALVHDRFTAEMAKAHNNANILCLGGRTTTVETAQQLVDTWLNTSFEGGRHQKRLDKLDIPTSSKTQPKTQPKTQSEIQSSLKPNRIP